MKVKRSDFSEEIRYVVTCPECESINEMSDESECEEEFICEHCNKVIEIEDDLYN